MIRRRRRPIQIFHWIAPWGPHCYLKQGRHEKPFSKIRRRGGERREERRFKQTQREACLASREYDDGWFGMGGSR